MKPPGYKNKSKNTKTNSYLADDENYSSFSTQLSKLGLELRDITGDGNCCFRALSDQMVGNESQHVDYRKRVCQYMRINKQEFEPFIAALIDDEDNSTKNKTSNQTEFDKYLKNMEQPGTYADNGCLVAFARLYQVNINIHQLNLPIWTIRGVENPKKNQIIRELHLSYHNGEHYSSIRPLGDKSNTPTNIFYVNKEDNVSKNQKSCKKFYYESETEDLVEEMNSLDLNSKIEQIMEITKLNDINSIKDKLKEFNFDTQLTIEYLLSKNDNNNQLLVNKQKKSINKKIDKKYEKKQRQMERQKQKVSEQNQINKINQELSNQSIEENQSSTNLVNLSNIQTNAI